MIEMTKVRTLIPGQRTLSGTYARIPTEKHVVDPRYDMHRLRVPVHVA